MRDVAREAGVATETLYTHFPSKAALLQRVVDIAVVGDEDPVALAERPAFQALGTGSRKARLTAAAQLVTAVHVRTAGYAKVIREAATTDAGMADVLAATRARQRRDVAAGIELLIGRPPTSSERDGAWALVSPEVYLLLVDGSGWAPDEYERWLAAALAGVVPRR